MITAAWQLAGVLAVLALSPATVPPPSASRFVYGGDARFAPYDYVDEQGVPTGFDVELIRRLARDAGVELEIRLDNWNIVRAELDAGQVDILSLSHTEERTERYDVLAQTWWMHQCVLFRSGRAAYPRALTDLAGETVAVQERSAVAEMLYQQVPPKPSLITTHTQDDALSMLESGIATGVGGNALSLRAAAAARGMDALVEMPLRAVPYGFMAKKGRAGELAWVSTGMARLRQSGAIEALAEKYLAVAPPRRAPSDQAFRSSMLVAVALLPAAIAILWIRTRKSAAATRPREGAPTTNESISALGTLVAGVAHEIRNPLFSISATIDTLEDTFGSRPEYDQFAGLLRNQVTRLTRLTRDLLDYGRSSTLKPARIDVASLFARVINVCVERAREQGVHLVQDVSPHLPALEVDVGRMEQVLENLVTNAIQHSPRGRSVRLAARVGTAPDTLELTIADQGLGLADDDVPHLFQPFFSRREGGTGLGLSIVQRIVESHGGRVTANNQRAGGAVFTVVIPLRAPALSSRAA